MKRFAVAVEPTPACVPVEATQPPPPPSGQPTDQPTCLLLLLLHRPDESIRAAALEIISCVIKQMPSMPASVCCAAYCSVVDPMIITLLEAQLLEDVKSEAARPSDRRMTALATRKMALDVIAKIVLLDDRAPASNAWYAGEMPKIECTEKVAAASNGDFLIRAEGSDRVLMVKGETVPLFSTWVRVEQGVLSHTIKSDGHGSWEFGGRLYPSLRSIVKMLRETPIKLKNSNMISLGSPAGGGELLAESAGSMDRLGDAPSHCDVQAKAHASDLESSSLSAAAIAAICAAGEVKSLAGCHPNAISVICGLLQELALHAKPQQPLRSLDTASIRQPDAIKTPPSDVGADRLQWLSLASESKTATTPEKNPDARLIGTAVAALATILRCIPPAFSIDAFGATPKPAMHDSSAHVQPANPKLADAKADEPLWCHPNAKAVAKSGGLECIKQLRFHENGAVREQAGAMIQHHFAVDRTPAFPAFPSFNPGTENHLSQPSGCHGAFQGSHFPPPTLKSWAVQGFPTSEAFPVFASQPKPVNASESKQTMASPEAKSPEVKGDETPRSDSGVPSPFSGVPSPFVPANAGALMQLQLEILASLPAKPRRRRLGQLKRPRTPSPPRAASASL